MPLDDAGVLQHESAAGARTGTNEEDDGEEL